MEILKSVIVLFVISATFKAHSAEHLECAVSKYRAATGQEDACGTFSFTLPKDNGYGNGTGACEGFQMYISWFVPTPGKEQAELVAYPDKRDVNRSYVSVLLDGKFPEHFRTKFMGYNRTVWYIDCAVRQQIYSLRRSYVFDHGHHHARCD